MTKIKSVETAAELDDARTLMREFVQWARDLSPMDREKVDAYFDVAAFETELAGLPGKFAPPTGRLLIATLGGQSVGCVALRRLNRDFCEMKRMFVRPIAHGLGIGRALAEQILCEGQEAGYLGMRLDTSCNQKAAMSLYESLGFHRIPAYYSVPDEFHGWLVFYERRFDV